LEGLKTPSELLPMVFSFPAGKKLTRLYPLGIMGMVVFA